MIRVLYFGVLKETLGREQETLEWSGGQCSDLLTLLRARGENWAQALAPGKVFRLVVNQQIVHEVRGARNFGDGSEFKHLAHAGYVEGENLFAEGERKVLAGFNGVFFGHGFSLAWADSPG